MGRGSMRIDSWIVWARLHLPRPDQTRRDRRLPVASDRRIDPTARFVYRPVSPTKLRPILPTVKRFRISAGARGDRAHRSPRASPPVNNGSRSGLGCRSSRSARAATRRERSPHWSDQSSVRTTSCTARCSRGSAAPERVCRAGTDARSSRRSTHSAGTGRRFGAATPMPSSALLETSTRISLIVTTTGHGWLVRHSEMRSLRSGLWRSRETRRIRSERWLPTVRRSTTSASRRTPPISRRGGWRSGRRARRLIVA